MSPPALARADLRTIYDATLANSDGNIDAALRAVYETGRGVRIRLERTRQTTEERKARAKEEGKFLRRRLHGIFEAVAARHGTTVARMLGKHERSQHVEIDAHRELCWLLRNASGRARRLSFPEIGGAVGRDHSSVIAAVKKTDRLIAERAEYRMELLAVVAPAEQRREVA